MLCGDAHLLIDNVVVDMATHLSLVKDIMSITVIVGIERVLYLDGSQ